MPEDPTPWLRRAPTIQLYARIAPQPTGFVARVLSLLEGDARPIGVIELDESGIGSSRGRGRVSWNDRITTRVSRWRPSEGEAGELSLELRSEHGNVGLRVPWPRVSLEALDAPEMRASFALARPTALEPLWRAVSWFAAVSGDRALPDLDWPDAEVLRGLAADGGLAVCVACGGYDITVHHADAYVCDACGYRGGAGWGRERRREQLDALEALDGEDRREAISSRFESVRYALGALVPNARGLHSVQNSADRDYDSLMRIATKVQGGAGDVRRDLADLAHLLPQLRPRIEPAIEHLDRVLDAMANEIEKAWIDEVEDAVDALGEEIDAVM